jgi:adenosyl cobinamide kinase/adenosyl cobinamide phosphate guanylyltransferase
MLTLVTGGARSGKSGCAMTLAGGRPGAKAFIATAEALDAEMALRIAKHKESRPPGWETFEEPVEAAPLLSSISGRFGAVVLDCLTLWLSNILSRGTELSHGADGVEKRMAALVSAAAQAGRVCDVYVVTNETGMGIVPDNELARRFRDLAGTLNADMARAADEVYLLVSGIPVKIK